MHPRTESAPWRPLTSPDPEEVAAVSLHWHAEAERRAAGLESADMAGVLAHVGRCLATGDWPGAERTADGAARRSLYRHLLKFGPALGLDREALARVAFGQAEVYESGVERCLGQRVALCDADGGGGE